MRMAVDAESSTQPTISKSFVSLRTASHLPCEWLCTLPQWTTRALRLPIGRQGDESKCEDEGEGAITVQPASFMTNRRPKRFFIARTLSQKCLFCSCTEQT